MGQAAPLTVTRMVGAAVGGNVFVALFTLLSRRFAPPKVPMVISGNGTRFIAQFEGFGPELHNDPVGHCTIGFGHLVHRGRCNGSEPVEFKRGLSEAQALALLAQDLSGAAADVNRLVQVSLAQPQFDALVSFVFNVGQGNFASSTFLRTLNQGDFASVPAQLNRFVFASGQKLPGLVRRRAAEGKLFSTGDYGDLTVPFDLVR
jgi:lysozyme